MGRRPAKSKKTKQSNKVKRVEEVSKDRKNEQNRKDFGTENGKNSRDTKYIQTTIIDPVYIFGEDQGLLVQLFGTDNIEHIRAVVRVQTREVINEGYFYKLTPRELFDIEKLTNFIRFFLYKVHLPRWKELLKDGKQKENDITALYRSIKPRVRRDKLEEFKEFLNSIYGFLYDSRYFLTAMVLYKLGVTYDKVYNLIIEKYLDNEPDGDKELIANTLELTKSINDVNTIQYYLPKTLDTNGVNEVDLGRYGEVASLLKNQLNQMYNTIKDENDRVLKLIKFLMDYVDLVFRYVASMTNLMESSPESNSQNVDTPPTLGECDSKDGCGDQHVGGSQSTQIPPAHNPTPSSTSPTTNIDTGIDIGIEQHSKLGKTTFECYYSGIPKVLEEKFKGNKDKHNGRFISLICKGNLEGNQAGQSTEEDVIKLIGQIDEVRKVLSKSEGSFTPTFILTPFLSTQHREQKADFSNYIRWFFDFIESKTIQGVQYRAVEKNIYGKVVIREVILDCGCRIVGVEYHSKIVLIIQPCKKHKMKFLSGDNVLLIEKILLGIILVGLVWKLKKDGKKYKAENGVGRELEGKLGTKSLYSPLELIVLKSKRISIPDLSKKLYSLTSLDQLVIYGDGLIKVIEDWEGNSLPTKLNQNQLGR